MFLCGSPLDDLMFYSIVPLGVYIGVISYNGKVSTGVCCVPECEPDASRIAKHWKGAVKELLSCSPRRGCFPAAWAREKGLGAAGSFVYFLVFTARPAACEAP